MALGMKYLLTCSVPLLYQNIFQNTPSINTGISVCMNTFNSVTIKDNNTLFGIKTFVYCTSINMHVNLKCHAYRLRVWSNNLVTRAIHS